MPPKRGQGQAQGGRGTGSARPKAKSQAAAAPIKPGLKPAHTTGTAKGYVEDTLSHNAVAEEPLSQEAVHISGDVAEADGSLEAEVTTLGEEFEILDETETDTEAMPMDPGQIDDENEAANISQEPSEKMELSDAGGLVHENLRKDFAIMNDDDDVIIIEDDDDEDDKETADEKLKEADNSRSFWSLRMCPIPFQGIAQNKDNFFTILAKSLNFQLRMSQHLINQKEEEEMKVDDISGAPWLPNDPFFDNKWQAATAGLLEFKLVEKAVPDVIKLISSCKFLRSFRIRFELTRITKEEALKSLYGQENLKKEAKDKKIGGKKKEDLKDTLQVNFAKIFPISPLEQVFLKHPEGHVKQEKDDYIFLTNVPDQLPDSILVAIMNAEMKERKLGKKNTGTAKFKVPENLVAEEYMSRFDGILVNSKMVEMSTVLGTLTDVNRLRSEAQKKELEETKKRKIEEKSTVVPAVKKSQWDEEKSTAVPAVKKSRWDEEKSTVVPAVKKSRWGEEKSTVVPAVKKSRGGEEKSTVVPAVKKSRWGPQLSVCQPLESANMPNLEIANKQGGHGWQQQGFAGREGRGRGSTRQRDGGKARQGKQQQNRQLGSSGNRRPQMDPLGNINSQIDHLGNRNSQMDHLGNRGLEMDHFNNRNSQMDRLGNINFQMDSLGNRSLEMDRLGNINSQMDRLGNIYYQMDHLGNINSQMDRLGNISSQMDRFGNRSPEMDRLSNQNSQIDLHGYTIFQMDHHGNRSPEMDRLSSQNSQMDRLGSRSPEMDRLSTRNSQMDLLGSRNSQIDRLGNRSPERDRPSNRNSQMDRLGSTSPPRRMDRPRQRSPSQSYQDIRDEERPVIQDNRRLQPHLDIGFDVKKETEKNVQIHLLADIQARLMEKQRELNHLQNQAMIQMALIEQQEMASVSQMQISPAGQRSNQDRQRSYQDRQPNRLPDRRQRNRLPPRQPNRQQSRQQNRPRIDRRRRNDRR